MKPKKLTGLLIILAFVLFTSCTQEEGFGGKASIKGTLMTRYFNEDYTILQYELPAKDEDVYLMFGESTTIDEDATTSYSGDFMYEYLWPGNYSIYYYSEDTTLATNEDVEMVTKVEITNGEQVDLDTLYLYEAMDWNDGFAQIRGKVTLHNYRNEDKYPFPDNIVVSPAHDYEVYLKYNHAGYYLERVRTSDAGIFVFPNLLKGFYTIYVYSEDVASGSSVDLVKSYDVEITELYQQVELGEIIVEQE